MGRSMRGIWHGVVLCCVWLLGAALPALAQTSPDGTHVRVLDTWPSGESVLLGRNQNFYLHLAYDAPKPTHLYVMPMYRGKLANVGMSGSQTYSGSGEAVTWFFLNAPGAQVDEVRIQTGDGGPGKQPTVTVWRGSVSAGSMASDLPNPEWLDRLMPELAERARWAEQNKGMPARQPPRESLLSVLAMMLFWLPALSIPLVAAWFLRGGWRLAMLVPAIGVLYSMLRFGVDVYADATSHNLWPFEVAMVTVAAFGYVLLVVLVWAFVQSRARRGSRSR